MEVSPYNGNLKRVASEKLGKGITIDPVADKREQRKGIVDSGGN